MKLKQRKVPFLTRAKDISLSGHYLVAYTGKRVHIADRELNLLKELDGFYYVYAGQLSPDETRLLAVSNANQFYLVSLADYSVERVTVKGEYRGNLEGEGCWSHDGKELLIPVQNEWGFSALRVYAADDCKVYRDILPSAYWLTHILPVRTKQSYLLTALDRLDHTYHLIWFDGENTQVHPLEGHDDVILSADYDEVGDTLLLAGGRSVACYDGQGHRKPAMAALDTVAQAVASAGVQRLFPGNTLLDFCVSSDGRYGFAADGAGLFVIDLATGEIAARAPEAYGVQAVKELSSGLVAASTWSGVKVYELC